MSDGELKGCRIAKELRAIGDELQQVDLALFWLTASSAAFTGDVEVYVSHDGQGVQHAQNALAVAIKQMAPDVVARARSNVHGRYTELTARVSELAKELSE